MAMVFCRGCGKEIHESAANCPHCGAKQKTAKSVNRSKTSAALLAFFLGGLGAHRFYLGQVGWGFVYLLFCWTLIPFIAAFIEFIMYLTMSEENFDEKYSS